jgi:hypothetical protein
VEEVDPSVSIEMKKRKLATKLSGEEGCGPSSYMITSIEEWKSCQSRAGKLVAEYW